MKAPTTMSWNSYLKKNDALGLWNSLYRLVSVHPLVRSTLRAQNGATHPTLLFSVRDLTQDLFVLLLEKGRFEHYLRAQMSDAEIEREIFQIELTNMLIGRLRRRRPENYRIVRRVSKVLESSGRFRVFNHNGKNTPARYHQSAGTIFGLREWSDDKPIKDGGTFAELIEQVPMRQRNRRRVGCRGEAQLIITNQELSDLMEEILRAIDSPAPLRLLRSLALSKLPVYDAVLSSLEDEVDEERQGHSRHQMIASTEASPEQIALRHEQEELARRAATEFLDHIHRMTRAHPQRTERFWRVLWHCYFDPAEPSQLSIAEMVGISDSSVSDYRRKLEDELRKLRLAPEELRFFAEELDEQLRLRLDTLEPPRQRADWPATTDWPRYSYDSLVQLEGIPVV